VDFGNAEQNSQRLGRPCRSTALDIEENALGMVLDAFHVAVSANREAIRRAARDCARGAPERHLLDGVSALLDGDVDGAVRLLRQVVNRGPADVAAAAADFLGPIFAMRHAHDEVVHVAGVLEAGGWDASASVFRAIAAADRGDRQAARRHCDAAEHALLSDVDPVVEARVLQRIARTAYFLGDHTRALNLAVRSARSAEKLGAWHTAAAAYSVAFNVYHDVLEDFAEADHYVRLFRTAATKTDDASLLQPALVAEFTVAVQIGDVERVPRLERQLRSMCLPEQYQENYPLTLAHAMVLGATDLAAMSTVLAVLRDTGGRSRAQSALCSSLIALAHAARRDDDAARAEVREAVSRLGRFSVAEPAYEQRLRRLTRATVAVACDLLGDHVRAARTLAALEVAANRGIRELARGAADVEPGLRGMHRVYENARASRATNEPPAKLTDSELEVLNLLGQGWSAGRIAHETGRSVNTVYNHTRSILGKLEAARAAEAVAIARHRGYIT
jgi:DNA-binding NarL/FixJ family response regulator/tetratricopeptide (TPR) repeat protein